MTEATTAFGYATSAVRRVPMFVMTVLRSLAFGSAWYVFCIALAGVVVSISSLNLVGFLLSVFMVDLAWFRITCIEDKFASEGWAIPSVPGIGGLRRRINAWRNRRSLRKILKRAPSRVYPNGASVRS